MKRQDALEVFQKQRAELRTRHAHAGLANEQRRTAYQDQDRQRPKEPAPTTSLTLHAKVTSHVQLGLGNPWERRRVSGWVDCAWWWWWCSPTHARLLLAIAAGAMPTHRARRDPGERAPTSPPHPNCSGLRWWETGWMVHQPIDLIFRGRSWRTVCPPCPYRVN